MLVPGLGLKAYQGRPWPLGSRPWPWPLKSRQSVLGLPYLGLGLNPLAVKSSDKIILSDAFAVTMAAE
jgi:hypothetical protein